MDQAHRIEQTADKARRTERSLVPPEFAHFTKKNLDDLRENGITELLVSQEQYRPIYHFKINLLNASTETCRDIEKTVVDFFEEHPKLGSIFGIRGGANGFFNGYLQPFNTEAPTDTEPYAQSENEIKKSVAVLALLHDQIIKVGQTHTNDPDFQVVTAVSDKPTQSLTAIQYGDPDNNPTRLLESNDSVAITSAGWFVADLKERNKKAAKAHPEEIDHNSYFVMISAPRESVSLDKDNNPDDVTVDYDTALAEIGIKDQGSIANSFEKTTTRIIKAPPKKVTGREITGRIIDLTDNERKFANEEEKQYQSAESDGAMDMDPNFSIASDSFIQKLGGVKSEGNVNGELDEPHIVIKADFSGLTKLVSLAERSHIDPGLFVKSVLRDYLSDYAAQLELEGKSFLISVEGDAVIFFITGDAREQMEIAAGLNTYLQTHADVLQKKVATLGDEYRDAIGLTDTGMKVIACGSLGSEPQPTKIRIHKGGKLSYETTALDDEDILENFSKSMGSNCTIKFNERLTQEEASLIFPQGYQERMINGGYSYSARTSPTFFEQQVLSSVDRLIHPPEGKTPVFDQSSEEMITLNTGLMRIRELYETIDQKLKQKNSGRVDTLEPAATELYSNNVISLAKILYAVNKGLQDMEGDSEDAYIRSVLFNLPDSRVKNDRDIAKLARLQSITHQYFVNVEERVTQEKAKLNTQKEKDSYSEVDAFAQFQVETMEEANTDPTLDDNLRNELLEFINVLHDIHRLDAVDTLKPPQEAPSEMRLNLEEVLIRLSGRPRN